MNEKKSSLTKYWLEILELIVTIGIVLISNIFFQDTTDSKTNIVIGVIGLSTIAITLAIRRTITEQEKITIATIDSTLLKLGSKFHAVEFLKGRESNFQKACEMLYEARELSTSAHIFLTDFGKDLHEKELRAAWESCILANCHVYQINHYDPLPGTIEQIRKDASEFPKARNYELAIRLGSSFTPYVDLLVVSGGGALLTTSEMIHNPTLAGSALFYWNLEIVNYFESAFKVMWNNTQDVAIIRKRGGEVDENAIKNLERQIQKQRGRLLELSMEANYDAASHMIINASPDSEICMTDLSMSEISGEKHEEYRQIRNRRIQNGDCYFRRLVSIVNEDDIKKVHAHLEQSRPGKRYELRIVRGSPDQKVNKDQPYFDTLIVGTGEALLQVPLLETGLMGRSAFHITEQESVMALKGYFDKLWEIGVVIKKPSEEIDNVFLGAWQSRLEKIPIRYGGMAKKK